MRIAVEGNIGGGKSEALAALATAFPALPVFTEPVDEWTDLMQLFYAAPAEWALAFSLKVLLSFRQPAGVATCLVERSPLATRHVFSQLLYNDGSLTHHEWELFKEYHDVLAWKPDAILYIDTPVDVCRDRIQQRGRGAERAIEEDYLRRVDFQYTNMLRFVDVPIVRFDGTLPPAELHAAMAAEVRKLISTE